MVIKGGKKYLASKEKKRGSEGKVQPPASPTKKGAVWTDMIPIGRSRTQAAKILQRAYRKRMSIRKRNADRALLKEMFSRWSFHRKATDRRYWRTVNLKLLSRKELQDIAKRLGIPHSGKKIHLLNKIQEWLYLPSKVHDATINAASTAAIKRTQAKGSVYYYEAAPGKEPTNILPLRARGITRVAANFDSDAIYAIDEKSGASWLCKTGGMSAQVGLCDRVRNTDVFDPPLETKWLVNPVAIRSLISEHIVEIQVARNHAAARVDSGEVYMWGNSPHGELGMGDENLNNNSELLERVQPRIVPVVDNYTSVSVAVGGQHTVLVCDNVKGEDGVVFTWGSNSHKQLGINEDDILSRGSKINKDEERHIKYASRVSCIPYPTRVELQGINVRQVSCGALHSVARTLEGSIYSWGCSDGGRLGRKKVTTHLPRLVSGLAQKYVIDVCCGAWHTAAVVAENSSCDSGQVYTWGHGGAGQLGHGSTKLSGHPVLVQIPPMSPLVEPIKTVACGMYHTAALTSRNDIYTWGSQNQFSSLPLLLPKRLRVQGRIESVCCGRFFTAFCVLPLDKRSYEEDLHELNPPKKAHVPKLDLSHIEPLPLTASVHEELRLLPRQERARAIQQKMAREERIDAINIGAIVYPTCRICWSCTGFVPAPSKMWMCDSCKHNKSFHGIRVGPLTEYEAIRKIQGTFRARRARFFLGELVRNRYQLVFHIPSNEFFYYNTWSQRSTWHRPRLLKEGVQLPIRDPDDEEEVKPPLTKVEAANIIKRTYLKKRAWRFLRKMMEERYEKRLDAKTGRFFYYNKVTKEVRWKKPMLLGKDDDIGQARSRRPARNITSGVAAEMIQSRFRKRQSIILVRKKIRQRYKKVLDKKSGHYYYQNIVTGEVSWTKPKLLGDEDISVLQPRTKKPIEGKEDAAKRIQRMFRARKARMLVKSMLNIRFKAILDEKTGKYYYYDPETKKVTWKKPKFLQTEEEKDERKKKKKKKKKKRRSRGPSVQQVAKPVTKKPPRNWDAKSAATAIQGVYRSHRARKYLRSLLHDVYVQHLDPKTGKYYYHNTKTGQVSWVKPRLLGSEELKPKERKKLSQVEAATMIQRMFKTRNARKRLRELIRNQFQKVFDPNTKEYFYYNSKTNSSSWTKPRGLGSEDLAADDHPEEEAKTRVLDESSAAVAIQGLFRLKKAREKARDAAQEKFEKVWDEEKKQFYYFNTVTGNSQWSKPKVLGANTDIRRIVNADGTRIMNDEEAALFIQKRFRVFQARRKVQLKMASCIEEHYDEVTKKVFYYNVKLQSSSWTKPLLLGSLDLRKHAAAKRIQTCYRRYMGYKRLHSMIRERFQKHYDADSKKYFYFDIVSQESQWHKPRLLGDKDID